MKSLNEKYNSKTKTNNTIDAANNLRIDLNKNIYSNIIYINRLVEIISEETNLSFISLDQHENKIKFVKPKNKKNEISDLEFKITTAFERFINEISSELNHEVYDNFLKSIEENSNNYSLLFYILDIEKEYVIIL